jgi:hypothetical protein
MTRNLRDIALGAACVANVCAGDRSACAGDPEPDHRPARRSQQHVRHGQPRDAREVGHISGVAVQLRGPGRPRLRREPGHGVTGALEQHRHGFAVRRRMREAQPLAGS